MVISDPQEPHHKARLTCIANDQAGILDHCMVQKLPDHIWLVHNASNATKIEDSMKNKASSFRGNIDTMHDKPGADQKYCLVAVQEPLSEKAVQSLAMSEEGKRAIHFLPFGRGIPVTLSGQDCHISRTGYTSEDRFEVSQFDTVRASRSSTWYIDLHPNARFKTSGHRESHASGSPVY
jgi:aminomethyltransferase